MPDELFTIEVADTGHGIGLTPQVARAVPQTVRMAVAEIRLARRRIEERTRDVSAP